jgi:hypothetical protein
MFWSGLREMMLRNVLNVPAYHTNDQSSPLCNVMYFFGLKTLQSGKGLAKCDVMMWITCNEAENSVERTSVPQEWSEFKLMQYNAVLWGINPQIRQKSSTVWCFEVDYV